MDRIIHHECVRSFTHAYIFLAPLFTWGVRIGRGVEGWETHSSVHTPSLSLRRSLPTTSVRFDAKLNPKTVVAIVVSPAPPSTNLPAFVLTFSRARVYTYRGNCTTKTVLVVIVFGLSRTKGPYALSFRAPLSGNSRENVSVSVKCAAPVVPTNSQQRHRRFTTRAQYHEDPWAL